MIDFSKFAPQQGFLIQGDEAALERVVDGIAATDPMVQVLSVPRFTIEHARNVAEFAVEGTGEPRTFIVYFSVFSSEAAQVLLKSLEEPAQLTTIILMTRYPYLVPQTVRSRLMLVHDESLAEGKQGIKKTLEKIVKEAAEKDDDAALRRARAIALLDELEVGLAKDAQQAGIVYGAKAMLLRANLPTKFVLDYVATVVR